MNFNRLSLLVAAASVASLVGTTATLAAEMDTLTAVINQNGKMVRGADVESSTRIAEGRYNVTFKRNIRQCAFVASASGTLVGLLPPTSVASATALASNPKTINVAMSSLPNGAAINSPFHLVVFCPK